MQVRSILLVGLPIFLICLSFVPNVRAQTTTITNLQYPAQVVLQNGLAQATVNFTVSYTGLRSGDILVFAIAYADTLRYVTGSAMSKPDQCLFAGTEYANSAVCAVTPSSSSGTDFASLSLMLNSTRQYPLAAFSDITDPAGNTVPGSITTQQFRISVNSQTISSTLTPQTSNATSAYSITSPGGTFNQVGTLASVGVAVVVVAVSLFLVVSRRKKGPQRTTLDTAKRLPAHSTEPSIPTGFQKLDGMLAGGLPEGHAVVMVSQSYDESDLLVRKVLESGVSSGRPTFYVSNDIARIRDASKLGQALHVLSPVADRIASERGNLIKIPDVGDLSNLNISLNEIIEQKSGKATNNIIVFDLLSDLLLRNKVVNTRRWLADFIARRKASGFTILATLNPSVAPKEDVQTIVGVFDGVIEIFEKPLQERTRRFLVIRKMFGRDYSEEEVMLDRRELLQSNNR